MLIKLLPEQVSKHWGEIKVAIEAALPPIVGEYSDRMNRILQGALMEEIEVWVSRNSKGDLDGVVSTTFTFDKLSGTKALLIYTVFSYGNAEQASWVDGLETLKKHAIATDCHMINAYSNVESIVKYIETLGGKSDFRFISIPLRG